MEKEKEKVIIENLILIQLYEKISGGLFWERADIESCPVPEIFRLELEPGDMIALTRQEAKTLLNWWSKQKPSCYAPFRCEVYRDESILSFLLDKTDSCPESLKAITPTAVGVLTSLGLRNGLKLFNETMEQKERAIIENLAVVKIDEENNSEIFWYEAEKDKANCPIPEIFNPELVAEDTIVLTKQESKNLLQWAERQPGWDDGPYYAPHPLFFYEINDDDAILTFLCGEKPPCPTPVDAITLKALEFLKSLGLGKGIEKLVIKVGTS
ncbi:MAG: hypothetical protein KatS3mg087_1637 [Patescibacteria group bacterium]|nr:MAG: hypothetical protein KatS3mg087_1637 [Patescibacteria group bacterium]